MFYETRRAQSLPLCTHSDWFNPQWHLLEFEIEEHGDETAMNSAKKAGKVLLEVVAAVDKALWILTVMFFRNLCQMFSKNSLLVKYYRELETRGKFTPCTHSENGSLTRGSPTAIPARLNYMDTEISGRLELSLTHYMVEVVKDEEDVVFMTPVVRTRFSSRLVSSLPLKASMKDHSNRMHSLVPRRSPYINYEDVVGDIITADNKVASSTLKSAEKTRLNSMKPLRCVLPCDSEEFIAQIGSDESVEVEISIFLNLKTLLTILGAPNISITPKKTTYQWKNWWSYSN